MKSYVFKVVVEEDQFEDGRGAYSAYCPALESLGASTWGHTKEEALKNIREVVQMVVDELIEEGKEIPLDVVVIGISGSPGDCVIPKGVSARDLIRALLRDGFSHVRTQGSHRCFIHPDGRRVTVSYHKESDTFLLARCAGLRTKRDGLKTIFDDSNSSNRQRITLGVFSCQIFQRT